MSSTHSRAPAVSLTSTLSRLNSHTITSTSLSTARKYIHIVSVGRCGCFPRDTDSIWKTITKLSIIFTIAYANITDFYKHDSSFDFQSIFYYCFSCTISTLGNNTLSTVHSLHCSQVLKSCVKVQAAE